MNSMKVGSCQLSTESKMLRFIANKITYCTFGYKGLY